MRASAKTGSTYLAPHHTTDLGRTAVRVWRTASTCPPYSGCWDCPLCNIRMHTLIHTLQHTHSQSLAVAIQALPSIRVNPETACSAHGHGGDEAVCLLQHKRRGQTVLKSGQTRTA